MATRDMSLIGSLLRGRLFSHRRRAPHLGHWPVERLTRTDEPPVARNQPLPPAPSEAGVAAPDSVAPSLDAYMQMLVDLRDGEVAPKRAPLPDDPQRLTDNLKASATFLDADLVGVCRQDLEGEDDADRYAVVVLVDGLRTPSPNDPGADWIIGTQQLRTDWRAAEIAVITAAYLRNLGFHGRAHLSSATDVDLHRLALNAGLLLAKEEQLRHPFHDRLFGLAAVTTDAHLVPDRPLGRTSLARWFRRWGPGYWLGWGGARPGSDRLAGEGRPLHLGRYPMEKLPRSPAPTTRITDDIPRVPERANFFVRAKHGDLGDAAKRELTRFGYKTPTANTYHELIKTLLPAQDGPVAERAKERPGPEENARSIKALIHYLGGDMVGICEAPDFAWYSHDREGRPIDPDHRYAITIVIDQGFQTMEGSSGDDWISSSQSQRAYLRGAQIAGVVADHIRRLGYPARAQTNASSKVLHLPLLLLSGVGELSRIGELVLNPFIGPRYKSVVITTDLPLAPDQPIDFGLQDFCSKCQKCARECPCAAIPFGPKIMFNGYETWKPDVEKCAKYRLRNHRGSACGRCMKECPFTTEGLLTHRLWLWIAMRFPWLRGWLARMDDVLGHGRQNPVKKWWFDLELVDGIAIRPERTNERDLSLDRGEKLAAAQKIALYPAQLNPPPDANGPVKPDRRAALEYADRTLLPIHPPQ